MSRSCAEQPSRCRAFAVRSGVARRLSAIESALTPTQMVLRWIAEAHAYGSDPAVTMPPKEATVTPRIGYTVGYEGVGVDAVALAAQRAGVTMVIDTRRNPTSRRPAFRREALRRRLEAHGIGYLSEPRLGVPTNVRPLARSRPWLFRAAYQGVLGRAASAVDETLRIAIDETIALLCYEAEAGECHRSLLAAHLSARAPVTFSNLHVRRIEDTDDHPRPEAMVSPHN